jgi:hypothetical protein
MNINFKQYASMATTVITAVGVLYAALSQIWGLPYGTEVTNTTLALAAFIAAVLGVNTAVKIVDANNNGIPDDEEEVNDGNFSN